MEHRCLGRAVGASGSASPWAAFLNTPIGWSVQLPHRPVGLLPGPNRPPLQEVPRGTVRHPRVEEHSE
jgi:hypothetical protein